VLTRFGVCSGCPEDVNNDGLVDVEDILAMLPWLE
jgi:hypothetical protein